MTDISKLAGVTSAEICILREHQVQTIEQLWELAAQVSAQAQAEHAQAAQPATAAVEEGGFSELLPGDANIQPPVQGDSKKKLAFDLLALKTGIPTGRLVALLSADRINPTRLLDRGALRRWPFFWIGLGAFLLLCLVSLGLRQVWPLNQIGRYPVLLARQDLVAGQTLDQGDVFSSYLPAPGDYLSSLDGLSGAILAEAVSASKPLHYTAILRPQLQAAGDLLPGAILKNQDLRLNWSTYQPGALTGFSQAIGHRLALPVQKGSLLLESALDNTAPLVSQVAAAPQDGLAGLRILKSSDLALVDSVEQPGAFTAADQLIGGLLLEPISAGDLVPRNQVLTPEQLRNRLLVSLPLGGNPLNPLLLPGDAVNLEFYPLDAKTSGLNPVSIPQVWLAALSPDGKSIIVAVARAEMEKLLPDLAKYSLQVILPASGE